MRITLFALAGGAAAQSFISSNPGGAILAGRHAPSIAGFRNATVSISRGGLAVCVSGTITVTANTTSNIKFNLEIPQNQTQLSESFVELSTSGTPVTEEIVGGLLSAAGTFTIGATLCTPADNTKPKGVQLLTHGVGFDRYYWDFAPGYSYVDSAVQNGYAAFFYDRLGVGVSDKPDALKVVQAPLQVEIAHELAKKLRSGSYSDIAFEQVVGVGHSFGSAVTQGVTAHYPSALDAAILTGFTVNSTGINVFLLGLNFAIANENQPYRFPTLSNGYIVSGTAVSNQIAFFRAPGFDPAILALAEAMKATATLGELLTTTVVIAGAPDYTKPLAVVNGAEDLPFCFGNCSYPSNKAAIVQLALYPNVSASCFGTYLAPDTGHGLNLHYGAVGAYEYIQTFLKEHGLGL
ncbi:hypothetical protein LTR36_006761 [Oleoguttula mirabilis]|uniref:AB hydrolase-1 domain-containing protein n=1 Tax=Oleoguttula mirabilis TaxID=1507867 RepID=A0AAV9JC60_9PEZI|nr:hypothetical protein LTR36_006761 [Oleoguttula mirabilis]